jgi:hypothetical protein
MTLRTETNKFLLHRMLFRLRGLAGELEEFRRDLKKNPGYGRALRLQLAEREYSDSAKRIRKTWIVIDGDMSGTRGEPMLAA